MDPVTIATAAGAVKPETIKAAGGLLESAGNGVGEIFRSAGSIGSEHHQIAANREIEEAKILAHMSPEQMKIYLSHKQSGRESKLETLAALTPLGPALAVKKLLGNAPS
jgi:hypothetical protein